MEDIINRYKTDEFDIYIEYTTKNKSSLKYKDTYYTDSENYSVDQFDENVSVIFLNKFIPKSWKGLLATIDTILAIDGIIVVNYKLEYEEIAEFEKLNYILKHSKDGIYVFAKVTSRHDMINYNYLLHVRDNIYREHSQKVLNIILSSFDNIIININNLSKLELSNNSIIRDITIYTKNSIEHVQLGMNRVKEQAKLNGEIKITAKRVSQNKVFISCQKLGLNIEVYNLFYDFDKLFQESNRIPIMLEHVYSDLAFLTTKDYESDKQKSKYFESVYFGKKLERKTSTSGNYKPSIPFSGTIIGLHKYGFKIGPIEVITTTDQRKTFSRDRYNIAQYSSDFLLRGSYYDVYDLKEKRNVYRIYYVPDRAIHLDDYNLTMKYLTCSLILDRPVIKDLELLKSAAATIVSENCDKIPNFEHVGKYVSDQYKYEKQVWADRKWLYNITI